MVQWLSQDDNEHGKVPVDALKDLVCGPLVGKRLELVQSVFEHLDRKRVGYIAVSDILAAHDARKHPSVMFGEKTVDQVHDEFQSSFQAATRQVGSSFVNLYQWLSYFQYVGGHVPNDEYFELLLKRVWKATSCTSLSEATGSNLQASAAGSGYSAEVAPMTLLQALQETNPAIAANYSKPSLSISTTSMPPPVPSRLHRNASVTTGNATLNPDVASPRAAHTTTEFLKGTQFAACMVDPSIRQPSPSHYALAKRSGSSTLSTSPLQTADAGTASVLQRMRATIKERGLRGLVALSRNLRLSDADSDGLLTLVEFKKALKGLNSVPLSDVDLRCLFNHLDQDRRGMVSVLAALDMIREPMNYRRFQLVQAAFQSIDRDGSGQLDASEIVQAYDASRHPDVIAGRTTEDAVFHEFLESFDVDDDSDNGSSHKISLSQWTQYYQNVSFFVHDDDLFDLTIRNTWQLSAQHLPSFVDDMCAPPPKSPGGHSMSTFQQTANVRVMRGTGHGSSQAFAILQPDLNSDHHSNATPHASGVGASSSQPGCMFAAAKQSKELRRIIAHLCTALKDQGAVGFISLQRKFRLMDDDQNGSISVTEFHKALHETKVHLAPADATTLFQYFDANHDGAVDFHEFLAGIREPMSERRMLFVRMAFDILDTDSNGVLEVSDIVDVYDARKHPDVLSGRKTEHDVFAEFLDTFGDVDHDGKITFDEWTRYYANISASIDDDDYFELMMRNAWHISGGHGWCANSANRRTLVNHADGRATVEEAQNATSRGPAGQRTSTSFCDILGYSNPAAKSAPSRRVSVANASDSFAACLTMVPTSKPPSAAAVPGATKAALAAQDTPQRDHPVGVQLIIAKLKNGLKAKGAHGFCGLSRKFRLMDDDGNGSLNVTEFRKAMKDMELQDLTDADLRLLFQYFDRDRSGSIDLNEFLVGVRDPLNERRVLFVREAFKRMDKDGNGLLEPSDIVEAYDASKHPDVLSGRKTADAVCCEFLETFDVDGIHNGKITWTQWLHYYENISASIDDDDYFELMMRNAWHISGGIGWCANSTNRRVLVTLADGTDIVKEVQNDLGVPIQDAQSRLRTQDDRVDAKSIATATCINLTQPATASKPVTPAGKKILTLREASSAVPMEMSAVSSASGASTNPGGDMVFHAIQYHVRQQRIAAIVQLRKRMLHYIDAKTGTISATHCSECLSATLGLRLNEAHCTALFAYINQLPEATAYDLSSSTGNGPNNSIGSRFLQQSNSSSKGNTRMGIRKFFHCVLGALSPACLDAAQRVFQALQRAGNGRVFPVALAKSFQAARHPDVMLGGASTSNVFQEFALSFELADSGASGAGDRAVAFEHFEAYCVNLRAVVGSDEMLQLLLRDCFDVR
uniref:EF-hand domain-containing protein n=1 Tax=Globisporangium ultimum (strain ATCC 200006 / CBS 805.95 / DAOM BR144) TaxID=431595 RepID=K3WWY2_GLOUD